MTKLRIPPTPRQRSARDFEIVFSSEGGFVWASWPATDVVVRLGNYERVIEVMQDFLAQDVLAGRMTRHL